MQNYTEPSKVSIKQWLEDDRPREKLLEKGRASLSNAELLAILIASGSKDESAVALCQRILKDNQGSIDKLAKLSVNELCKYKGIGPAKALSIVAALELGRRKKEESGADVIKIVSSNDAFQVLAPRFEDLNVEEFHALYLNRANRVLKIETISQGGMVGTVADIRVIFKKGIDQQAVNMIVAHNHPSGNLTPSQQDIELTKKLLEAGKVMDIQVLDHLIIAGNKYYSFRDENML